VSKTQTIIQLRVKVHHLSIASTLDMCDNRLLYSPMRLVLRINI